jgi:hypothetical protein
MTTRFLLLVAVALMGCDGDKSTDTALPGIALETRVLDAAGEPIAGAHVLMGGWTEDRWVQTDEDGLATVGVADGGWTEQYLLAGKEGWSSGGVRLDFDELPSLAEIELLALPEEDNLDYHFQPGGDGSSPDTSECGHCHWTIGDDWAGSAHAEAASSEHAWDLYTGSALSLSEEDCTSLSGWISEGRVPGSESETAEHCYTGHGVLPWLHESCGGVGQPACDHPDESDTLESFGSCADCHAPAIDGGTPGHMDLAQATGVGFEGVTCDLCHKIQSVEPGTRPGLDGAIALLRPSEETFLPNQEYRPITFGPYPDVIVPIMNGSYAPQFSESEWCSGCHEYAQPALHPDQSLDVDRWPDGIPVFETWSEYSASDFDGLMSCQDCHMPALDEESSTYDITPLGLEPSIDQGWMREDGEVRHHSFSREGMGSPGLIMEITEVDGELKVLVTVKNSAAGHAVPTGEPMKQLLLRVRALDEEGTEVMASGGQVVPDVGGYRAEAILGEDAQLEGRELTLVDSSLENGSGLVVRFIRPTGSWDDYEGPGTAHFSSGEWSAEEKGLELEEFLGEIALISLEGDVLTLADDPPETQEGDRIYVAAETDYAGESGWLYAKTLVDSDGARGVPHYRAVDVASDNRIAPGSSGTSEHYFALTESTLTIEATLLRRDRAAAVADPYGWDTADLLIRTTTEVVEP